MDGAVICIPCCFLCFYFSLQEPGLVSRQRMCNVQEQKRGVGQIRQLHVARNASAQPNTREEGQPPASQICLTSGVAEEREVIQGAR